MRRLSRYLVLLLAAVYTVTAVAEMPEITDMTGRKVKIPAGAERILTTCTSATDIFKAFEIAPYVDSGIKLKLS